MLADGCGNGAIRHPVDRISVVDHRRGNASDARTLRVACRGMLDFDHQLGLTLRPRRWVLGRFSR
jgi:hypothetical protein